MAKSKKTTSRKRKPTTENQFSPSPSVSRDSVNARLFPEFEDPDYKARLQAFLPRMGEFETPEAAIAAFIQENEDIIPEEDTDRPYNFDEPISALKALSPSSLKKWKYLLELSSNFARLAPWKKFMETDLFGVKDPESGVMGYCSIMGNRGEHLALGVYRGEAGLSDFIHLETDFGFTGPEPYYFLLHQNTLQLSFEPSEELQPPDIALYQKINYKPSRSNLWPVFRDYTPGFIPWFLSEAQRDYMIHVLEQALIVIPQLSNLLSKNPPILNEYQEFDPHGKILCRIPQINGNKQKFPSIEWINEYQKFIMGNANIAQYTPPAKLPKKLVTLNQLPLDNRSIWEFGLFYTEDIFQDNRERPHFGRVAILIDRRTKYILLAGVLAARDPASDLYTKLFHILETVNCRPKTLIVPSNDIYSLIEPFARTAGIVLKVSSNIHALLEAVPSFPNIIIA